MKTIKGMQLFLSDYVIDLKFRSQITIVQPSDLTEILYSKFESLRNTKEVITINCENYKAQEIFLKSNTPKLIVMNEADKIQQEDDNIMYHINRGEYNDTFLIIGNQPKITCGVSDRAELIINEDRITLNYLFPEPLI